MVGTWDWDSRSVTSYLGEHVLIRHLDPWGYDEETEGKTVRNDQSTGKAPIDRKRLNAPCYGSPNKP